MMIITALAVVNVAAGDGWMRGDFGKLAFTSDCRNYTWTVGSTVFVAQNDTLANVTSCAASSGADNHGAFDELVLTVGLDGHLSTRYYPVADVFVFTRLPLTANLPQSWPAFSSDGFPEGEDNLKLRCLSWGEHFFFPGMVLPRTAHTNPSPFTMQQCKSGGPLFVFGIDELAGTGFVLSALDNFTTQTADGIRVSVGQGGCGKRCTLFSSSAVLLARPGLTRSTRAFGAFIRQWHNTTRKRGPGVTQLSYWNDNQAGYSWWTVGPDQEVWGKPEDIYLKLKAEYDKVGIPIRGWEPDNNWLADYGGNASLWGNGSGTAKNWIGRQWDYNPELYPSGGQDFVNKMGNLSMTYYTNGFGADNVYKNITKYRMQKNNEPHPTTSYLMYNELISAAKERYNMEMLFTDFLCYRQPAMEQYQDVPDGEEGGHLWLGGQARAAADNGVEVQWCMALAHQVLESTQFPAVTNTRVNGDGGLDIASMTVPALLAATVGLGWSKDNLRTANRCYVNGLYPNGTVKWPCGSINKGEGTSGQFKMQTQQTVLATLSLGPVGISDQLSSYPSNASSTITSNISLVMSTCAASGDLLQPSYPLTPVERSLIGEAGPSIQLWATYTSLPNEVIAKSDSKFHTTRTAYGTKHSVVWFTVFAFVLGKADQNTQSVEVLESDIAPMIDTTAMPTGSFSDIPTGSFRGNGSALPENTTWISWEENFLIQERSGCEGVNIQTWHGSANVSLTMDDDDGLLNIAPVLTDLHTLLGEAGKVTAISTYRFSSISTKNSVITVNLRGLPTEVVTLLFASRTMPSASFSCKTFTATIGSNGTARVTYGGGLGETSL